MFPYAPLAKAGTAAITADASYGAVALYNLPTLPSNGLRLRGAPNLHEDVTIQALRACLFRHLHQTIWLVLPKRAMTSLSPPLPIMGCGWAGWAAAMADVAGLCLGERWLKPPG